MRTPRSADRAHGHNQGEGPDGDRICQDRPWLGIAAEHFADDENDLIKLS